MKIIDLLFRHLDFNGGDFLITIVVFLFAKTRRIWLFWLILIVFAVLVGENSIFEDAIERLLDFSKGREVKIDPFVHKRVQNRLELSLFRLNIGQLPLPLFYQVFFLVLRHYQFDWKTLLTADLTNFIYL
jgi:hypothetical protein